MPGKLRRLAAMIGLVAAATLLPTAAWAGDHGYKRQFHGHDWRDNGHRHFTIITQPKQRLEIHGHPRHFGHHQGYSYGYVAPSQPVWVPAAWYWTGYQWVWVAGYWAW